MRKTAKISIAINEGALREARRIAHAEGLSLSGLIGRALEKQLEEQRRIDAARQLHATWGAETEPSDEDRKKFIARMSSGAKRRPKAA
jgi:hypothetical protein